MGSLFGTLGHAASGFEEAHQADLQRQFTEEQGRRQTAHELFNQLAFDPNQPDEIRNAALQGKLDLTNTPLNKAYNFQKATSPLYDLLSKHKAAQLTKANAPPPPPFETQVPGMQAGSTTIPGTTSRVQGPPPPPPSFLADIPQIAQNTGTVAAAQSGGALRGQIGARQEALSQIPDLLPELKAGFALGVPMMGTMNRTIGSGAGYAKDLREQGLDVPDNIKDDQWVNIRKLGSGAQTFEPAAAPGEKSGGQGTLLNPLQMEQGKANIRYGVWSKENKTRFGQQLALQNNAFSLAVQRGYLGDADRLFSKASDDYIKGIQRTRVMDENYADAVKGNQQAMVSLVMNHIGMTAGAQPGMRMARATIEEAIQSAPWMQNMVKKWFHTDETGDYVFDGFKQGINLSDAQMKQMVELAHQKANILHDTLGTYQQELNPSTMEFQAPGIASVGGASRSTKSKSSGPPKPPATGKKQAYQLNGKWYDAATHQEIH